MNDLFRFMIRRDFDDWSDSDLKTFYGVSGSAVDSILSGLTAVGNMAYWAAANKDYPEHQAKDDLFNLGYMLGHLPTIVNAINDNRDEALCTIRSRENTRQKKSLTGGGNE